MDTFSTTDINLAVCLVTIGFKIENTEKFEKRFTWKFQDSEKLQDVKEEYYAGKLLLPADKIFYYQRLLRSQMHNSSFNQ